MKSIFDKASDKINLVMITKMEGTWINKFNDTGLKIIKKKIEKIENSVLLEAYKIKYMTRKELEEFKAFCIWWIGMVG